MMGVAWAPLLACGEEVAEDTRGEVSPEAHTGVQVSRAGVVGEKARGRDRLSSENHCPGFLMGGRGATWGLLLSGLSKRTKEGQAWKKGSKLWVC